MLDNAISTPRGPLAQSAFRCARHTCPDVPEWAVVEGYRPVPAKLSPRIALYCAAHVTNEDILPLVELRQTAAEPSKRDVPVYRDQLRAWPEALRLRAY